MTLFNHEPEEALQLRASVSTPPPLPSRSKSFVLKRVLFPLLLIAILISIFFVGLQAWNSAHQPPLLSVKVFHVPFVPLYSADSSENNSTLELHQIITGPDGNLWFIPDIGNWIGRITPDGQVSQIFLPGLPSDYQTVWAGISSSRDSIWVSQLSGHSLWRLDPYTGVLKNYERMGMSKDYQYNWWNGIAMSDGTVWFDIVQNNFLSGESLAMGHLDPRTGVLKSYPENVKGCCGPLVQANDRKLWMLTAQI